MYSSCLKISSASPCNSKKYKVYPYTIYYSRIVYSIGVDPLYF